MSATTINSHQDSCSRRAKRGGSEDTAGRDRGAAAGCRRPTIRFFFLLKSINLERTFKLIPNYDTPPSGSTQKPNQETMHASVETHLGSGSCAPNCDDDSLVQLIRSLRANLHKRRGDST